MTYLCCSQVGSDVANENKVGLLHKLGWSSKLNNKGDVLYLSFTLNLLKGIKILNATIAFKGL